MISDKITKLLKYKQKIKKWDNEKVDNSETSENNENTEYIGEEEQQEESLENEEKVLTTK